MHSKQVHHSLHVHTRKDTGGDNFWLEARVLPTQRSTGVRAQKRTVRLDLEGLIRCCCRRRRKATRQIILQRMVAQECERGNFGLNNLEGRQGGRPKLQVPKLAARKGHRLEVVGVQAYACEVQAVTGKGLELGGGLEHGHNPTVVLTAMGIQAKVPQLRQTNVPRSAAAVFDGAQVQDLEVGRRIGRQHQIRHTDLVQRQGFQGRQRTRQVRRRRHERIKGIGVDRVEVQDESGAGIQGINAILNDLGVVIVVIPSDVHVSRVDAFAARDDGLQGVGAPVAPRIPRLHLAR